ncbi:MAG: DUF2130 domain-containing protein [Elusimicrobia bacterium]|nr:DUF2130 domain-containing protein [Elusimicrobiota bacterium]
MIDQSILCPHCGKTIPLTEALTHPIEEKLRGQFSRDLAAQKAAIEAEARKSAREALGSDLADLKSQVAEKGRLLEEARAQEFSLRKRGRELEEKEKSLALELERKLDAERAAIKEEVLGKAAEEHRLKEREKDKQLDDMRKQIEELKRKAEQGSQQAQGEVQELELEDVLKQNFRSDEIAPVAKGVRGADVLQTVFSSSGKPCGSILWESKRTKAWSDGWIQKLKDDQREAKADLGILVSANLPKGVSHVGCVEGVWVADFSSAMGLGTALRAGILQAAIARNALVGKGEKMELIYNYLSGPEFRNRVQAIVDAFAGMKVELDAEKRTMERVWAKRDKQLERVLLNTAGMYGDLQGLIGAQLAPIPQLELSAEHDEKSESAEGKPALSDTTQE